MVEAALRYGELGYALLPLEPGSKRPLARLVPHGLKGSTTDPEVIRRWFTLESRANIGLLPPAEVLVLDVDTPERWPELVAEYPSLAEAPRQTTPRGGVHVFLRLPPEVVGRVSATTRRIEGVDLRGMGRAYLVVAPSSVGGKTYQWQVPLVEPHRLPLVPAALLERLLPPPKPTPAPVTNGKPTPGRLEGLLGRACSQVASTPEGSRHNSLLDHARLVGGWLHHGLDEGVALEALTQAGVAAGLPEAEARSTARDGLAYGKAAPLPLPESNPPAAYGRLSSSTEQEGPTCPLDGRTGGGEVQGQPRYKVKKGRILAAKLEGRGEAQAVSYWPLCNFASVITREIARTDGLQTELWFELEGYAGSRPLPRARVKAGEFSGMGWVVREWGSAAVVSPGQGAKDHLRAAIQYLSDPERATVYAHTGWTRIDGRWAYLHAGGAIGAERVEVELPPELAGFTLPEPGRVEEALALLEVAPGPITWPLLLYALAAPLNHPLGSLYLHGPTGAGKTTLALLVQALWGHTLPLPPVGWEATVNALEALAFAAKDALLLIDDYAPTGHEAKQKELQAKAARLLRSQGNAVGRARMRPDGSLHADRPPRGSLLISGEDLPPGHSLRARCLFLELPKGALDFARVSALQREPGRLAGALAAWIAGLAPRLEEARERVKRLQAELRPRYPAAHGRTTDALARLHAVWVLLREVLEAEGVPTTRLDELEASMNQGLQQVGRAQAEHQRDADPAERFGLLLFAALRMGRGHLLPVNWRAGQAVENYLDDPQRWGWRYRETTSAHPEAHGVWEPQGPCIGWLPDKPETAGIYLDPTPTYAALTRLASETGEPLPTPRTLWKRLAERGAIRTQEEGDSTRTQAVVKIGGKPTRVVHLLGLYISKTGNSGNHGNDNVQDEKTWLPVAAAVTGASGNQTPVPEAVTELSGNRRNSVQDAKTGAVTGVTGSTDISPQGLQRDDELDEEEDTLWI